MEEWKYGEDAMINLLNIFVSKAFICPYDILSWIKSATLMTLAYPLNLFSMGVHPPPQPCVTGCVPCVCFAAVYHILLKLR